MVAQVRLAVRLDGSGTKNGFHWCGSVKLRTVSQRSPVSSTGHSHRPRRHTCGQVGKKGSVRRRNGVVIRECVVAYIHTHTQRVVVELTLGLTQLGLHGRSNNPSSSPSSLTAATAATSAPPPFRVGVDHRRAPHDKGVVVADAATALGTCEAPTLASHGVSAARRR